MGLQSWSIKRKARRVALALGIAVVGGCAVVAGVDFDKARIDPTLYAEGGVYFGAPAAPPGTDGCPPDQKKCNTTCVSRTDPNYGCGLADCSPCSLAHTTGAACGVGGACIPKACEPGFDDCDHDPGNGCESDLNRPDTCGKCDIKCGIGMLCSPTGCVADCTPPLKACNGSCVNTQTSPTNCGNCGTVCTGGANADPACVNSQCALACRTGFGDCANNPAKACAALPKWYVDTDNDNYGTAAFVANCTQPAGHSPNSGDCLDSNPAVHPGAAAMPGPFAGPNGPSFDYDCNGTEVEADNPIHFINCGACNGNGYIPLAPPRAGAGVNNYCGSPTRHVCFSIPMGGGGCQQVDFDSGVYIKCN